MPFEARGRRSFMLAALALPVVAVAGTGSVLSPGAAINKAGRQRMLSQRMAKAFAMQVLGVMPERAAMLLAQSQRLFEAQLTELSGLLPSEPLHTAWSELETAWMGYREALGRTKAPDNVRAVLVESDKTLHAAHLLTSLYEKQASGPAGHLVNIAGRQRMLSQRMAKCFLVEQSGLASPLLRQELAAARADFVGALDELNRAPENTPEIRIELALANTQWLFFEQALGGHDSRDVAVRNVATTSERILEVMDGLTGYYEKLVRS